MDFDNYEIIQVDAPSAELISSELADKAAVDVQVSTAKQYPRNLSRCMNNAIVMATIDQETAQSCSYALPRGGKPITGPSVHLAKILVQQYGNIRAEAKVVQITDKQIVSRGTAWDLENNYAVAFEVRRSIVGKYGRYSDDMIAVTGNAANSIAFRNAVFAVIPKSFTDKVYQATQRLIVGDLTDEENLIRRRDAVLKGFNDTYGITEEEVIKLCGKQTINQIKIEELALLIGIAQALNDGDTTVADVMRPIRESKEAKKESISSMARQNAAKYKTDAESKQE